MTVHARIYIWIQVNLSLSASYIRHTYMYTCMHVYRISNYAACSFTDCPVDFCDYMIFEYYLFMNVLCWRIIIKCEIYFIIIYWCPGQNKTVVKWWCITQWGTHESAKFYILFLMLYINKSIRQMSREQCIISQNLINECISKQLYDFLNTRPVLTTIRITKCGHHGRSRI